MEKRRGWICICQDGINGRTDVSDAMTAWPSFQLDQGIRLDKRTKTECSGRKEFAAVLLICLFDEFSR